MGARLFEQVILCVHLLRPGWEALHCLAGKYIPPLVSLQPRRVGKFWLSLEISGKGSGNVGQAAQIWEITFSLPHSTLDKRGSDLE